MEFPNNTVEAIALTGSGSNRRYWRLKLADGSTLIATEGINLAENEAFLYLDGKFLEAGINVPKVVAVSADRMSYIQTDVGNKSLYECLDRRDLIAKAIDLLAKVQQTPGIDWTRCYPVAEFDRRSVMWDLNYFKYCFLKTTPGVEIDEPALEDDFERLADKVLGVEPWGFMVRDFQSRNVMVKDDDVYLIDFQGGRRGPVHYDVASFLWQARAGFSDELRSEMVSRLCCTRGIDESRFRAELPYFVVLRLLQALGAYGFRGRFEGKEQFLIPIPAALASLQQILAGLDLRYLLNLVITSAGGRPALS
ncbi:MAG: phosphotransferase [Bacteroides sp.]|nr:phosphotransferase [Bacteroides sp.]MCM1379259.1 phosphotransferase [Bacteroides sp.]MCM1445083.1 phosphotransferase [Prevotella sp.]